MTVSDASRATDIHSKPEISDEDMDCYVHYITDNLPISETRLQQLQAETRRDPTLNLLSQYTIQGWPDKDNIPSAIKPYYPFRGEISSHLDILLKGIRIIIPESMRKEILSLVHHGHFGIEKSRIRARSSVYWPCIDNEIEQLVNKCSTCLNNRNKQPRETLIPHEIPKHPWMKVATDLFELNDKDYVIVIDYYSKFVEVTRLYNTLSRSVVKALKKIFTIHGIPKQAFSDNGPQCTSKEFQQFGRDWDFIHDTSSPEYPQSNGLVERSIQTVKRVLLKAEETVDGPYLGLLNLNNTPLNGSSPAEKMFDRRPRTLLPSVDTNKHMEKITDNRLNSYDRYNEGARDLKSIEPDTPVRIYSK